MAFSKIILNGDTLVDLTADTVATTNLLFPNTAHDASGAPIIGTMTGGIDGNNIGYGITDGTIPLAGVAVVGSAVLFETAPEVGTAQAGYTYAG